MDAISPAFEHTKQQLLQPFRFGQWTRLALVGLLAGELGSGGGCNVPTLQLQHSPAPARATSSGSGLGGDRIPLLFAGLIAVLVVAGFVLGILLMYVSSVMRFVLFDSVLAKECHIRQGWSRGRARDAIFRLEAALHGGDVRWP